MLLDGLIVILTGARQVGKTTFLKHGPHKAAWEYLALDDLELLDIAQKQPQELLAGGKNLIIDEVQKAPKILSAIKTIVDSGSNKKFILSGSANLLLMHKVSESLAGRAVYHIMRPMTYGETQQQSPARLLDSLLAGKTPNCKISNSSANLEHLIIRGFLPPAVVQFSNLNAVIGWLEGYVATFIERDLQQLAQIENLADFRRLMGILALRSGQIINQTEISRDASISQPTIHRYMNLLETAFLIERIPAYAVNRTKRLIKSPKLYWFDCGIAAFLIKYHSDSDIKKSKEWGALFETLVMAQLKSWTGLKVPAAQIFYWRTTDGHEVDFVLEAGNKLIAIEVKDSREVAYSDVNNIRLFMEQYPKTVAGLVVHSGNSCKQLGEKIWAIPWQLLS